MVKNLKESVTFRLDKPNLRSLYKESERKRISLNALANQIIDEHVDWHSFSAEANLISFPKALIKKLLDNLTSSEIAKIAKEIAQEEIKDILLLLRKNNNPESFLDIIETWLKVSNFPYTHDVDDSFHEFIIQHDMGKSVSIYLSSLFEKVFDLFELKKAKFDITDNTVVFSVDTKKP